MAKKKTVLTVEITPVEKRTPVPPKKVAPVKSQTPGLQEAEEMGNPDELLDETTSTPEKDPTADLAAATGSPIRTRRNTITLAASLLGTAAKESTEGFDWKVTTDAILVGMNILVDESKKYKALRRAVRRECLTLIEVTDLTTIERLKLK